MTIRLVLMAVLVLLAAVLAGCSGTDPEEPAPVPPAVTSLWSPATTTPPAESPTVPVTTDGPAAKLFGRFSRVEYRENITQTLPPNPRYQWERIDRLERTETVYQGVPAIREKITTITDYPEWSGDTLVTTKDAWVIVSDRNYAASTKKFLGGTWDETIKGTAQSRNDHRADPQHDPEDRPRNEMGIAPFGDLNITLTDDGAGPVTVPAGTWTDARKYSGRFHDGTPLELWVVPWIPVPVQYRIHNRYLDGEDPVQTYELISWE